MTQKTQTLTPAYLIELLTNLPAGHKIEISKTPGGEVIMSQEKTKAQLIEEKYSALAGQGISLSEAAQKYDVPRATITSWVYRSADINFVDETSYPKLVNEAEVALCSEIYWDRKKREIAGIPFFDENEVLIDNLKHPGLSEYRRRKRSS